MKVWYIGGNFEVGDPSQLTKDSVLAVEHKGRRHSGTPYYILDLDKDVCWGSWSDREKDMHEAKGDPVFIGGLVTDEEWQRFLEVLRGEQ